MNKQEFLDLLAEKLSPLGPVESYKSVLYYSEMIADRMEDGMSEQEAVAAMGNIEKIVEEIMMSASFPVLMKAQMEQKKPEWNGWKIALIILLSPVWIPLALAAFCVVMALLIALFSLVVSLIAIVFSLVVSGLALVVVAPFHMPDGLATVLAMLGAGFLIAGIGLFLYFAAKQAVIGCYKLVTAVLRGMKRLFIKRGRANQ